jgi:hypothetical protein
VHQRQPLFRFAAALARHPLPCRHLADQVQNAPLAFRRIEEDLLIQPLDCFRVQHLGPRLEEQQQKIQEKRLDQGLETLVVIHGRRPFHSTARPALDVQGATKPHPERRPGHHLRFSRRCAFVGSHWQAFAVDHQAHWGPRGSSKKAFGPDALLP